jgi:hypothetical protein
VVTVRAERSAHGWRCKVSVETREERTEHTVTVSPADLSRWGRGEEQADVEQLVARSFDLLLEREPARSILKSFALSEITRYFPEFDQVMRPPA